MGGSEMNANELRIGNLVVYPKYDRTEGTDRYFFVRDLYFEGKSIGLTTGSIQTQVDFDRIKPIPLTEEWLLRFGFVGRKDFMWKGNCGVQIMDEIYYFAFKDMGNVLFHSVVECKHVHQLQNLYFALTCEELTYTK